MRELAAIVVIVAGASLVGAFGVPWLLDPHTAGARLVVAAALLAALAVAVHLGRDCDDEQ